MSDNTVNPMESKNIKDYLHLYLGCEVQTEFGTATLVHVGILGSSYQIARTLLSGLSMTDAWVETNKLILRPLSDMTEEEDQIEFPKNNRGEFIDMHWYPEGYVWLLSKGFDLFGLIDAGVAIKKSQ